MAKKIRILLISQYFPPEVAAGANRTYEHAKRWVKNNAEVTVVTCFPNYPDGIIPPEYKGRKYTEEDVDGIKVIRTFTYAAPNRGFFKRALAYFSFMFSSVIQTVSKIKNYDVIIASSPPYTVGISGMVISAVKKIPFVFEVRDLWPESIIQLGQVKNKFVIKILEYVELLMYKKAKMIVGISDPFVDFIAAKGIPREKIKIIKNGVNLNLFKPEKPDEQLKNSLGLSNKFVVSYFGTFGLAQGLSTVLEAANIIKKHDDISFLFMGDGAEKEKLYEMKKKLGLENVLFLKSLPKSELVKYYAVSDAMLVPLRKLTLFNSALPSKMFEIMAMRKPIIHTVDGEARKLIEAENAGIYVEAENPQALADAIIKANENRSEFATLGENGRKLAETQFDRDKLANDYLQLLKDLFND